MVALITGASSGIGEGFARALAQRGYNLVLVARRIERLNVLAQELTEQHQCSVVSVEADLASVAGCKAIQEYLKEHTVDLLINNAGRGSFGYFEGLSLAQEEEMIALNVTAPVRLAHAIIPQLKLRKRGGIITVASVAGFQPLPYMATYAATKVFDLFHSIALHFELRRFGVHALAVCPGPVATEFGGVARVPGKMTGLPRDSVERVVAESLRAYDAKRIFVVPCLRAKAMRFFIALLPYGVSTFFTERTLRATLEAVDNPKKSS